MGRSEAESPLRSLAKQGLLLIFCLTLVGILTALFMGAIWLIIRAPQVIVLGVVLLVMCAIVAALASSLGSRV